MHTPEIWIAHPSRPADASALALEAERDGFDGLSFGDSQNLQGDPFVSLGLAAVDTQRIGLATGVTNPITRHPAVVASAALSLSELSDGRFVLGIGRGDSALAHLGTGPARLATFEAFIVQVRDYLSGDGVSLDAAASWTGDRSTPLGSIDLGVRPALSQIEQARVVPPVQIDVSASGPLTLEIGGRLADRVSLSVGADRDRVQWAKDVVVDAARRSGRARPSIGAWVTVAVADDRAAARSVVAGTMATLARMSAMSGRVTGPVAASDAKVFTAVGRAYDANAHGQGATAQTAALTTAFIDRFAVVGPADHCIEKLRALVAVGLDRLYVGLGAGIGAGNEARRSYDRFVTEVLPAVTNG